jgi:flagellar protein FlaG
MSVASVGFIPAQSVPLPADHTNRGQAQRQPDAAVKHSDAAARLPDATVKQSDAAASQTEPKKDVKPHVIHSTAADLEQIGLVFNRKLQFEVDHNSHQVIIKVIDKETDKVIKELPPEELQRLHNNLKETIGFLFDERV